MKERVSKLTFIEFAEKRNTRVWNLYRCECGETKILKGSCVKALQILSCGCSRTKHGHTVDHRNGSGEYQSWKAMIQRCNNPKTPNYKNYGGRGISICKEWTDSFPQFLKDMGVRPEKFSIDRTDNDGNYCKDNCEWRDKVSQNRNKRMTTRNTSGHVGVHFRKEKNVWQARINFDKKTISLGCFKDIEDAKLARLAGEKKYWNK